QVPIADIRTDPEHRRQFVDWLSSYRPDELFDEMGCPTALVADNVPKSDYQMGLNPNANGGLLLTPLHLPAAKE
ncbi:hypothetical protein, partial [Escherichia coli]|uniref:hypothetical protein n=1 Tax=Escherichia coli TaxID=562 RepID=UPI003CE4B52C